MEIDTSINKIWFLGRSCEEYMKMFHLDEDSLKNHRILDCAAGASSFTPILSNKGFDVTAVDILYDVNPYELEKRCKDDFNTLLEVHSGLDNKVDWTFFKNSGEMIKLRVEVYKEFIRDYKNGKGKRYIRAELTYLPFKDNHFGLVLCSHLLFLYDDRLSYDFHLESIKEMLRVSSKEVRIYPLVTIRENGEKSQFLERIIEDLDGYGIIEMLKVDYKFRRGWGGDDADH